MCTLCIVIYFVILFILILIILLNIFGCLSMVSCWFLLYFPIWVVLKRKNWAFLPHLCKFYAGKGAEPFRPYLITSRHHHHHHHHQNNHNHLQQHSHHSHNNKNKNNSNNSNGNSIGIVSPTKPSATSPCMKGINSDNGTLSIESSRSNALSANEVPMTGLKVVETINTTSPLKANKPIAHPKLNQQQQTQQQQQQQQQGHEKEQEEQRCQDKSPTKSNSSASGSSSAFEAVSAVGKVLSLFIANSFIFIFYYPFFLYTYSSSDFILFFFFR